MASNLEEEPASVQISLGRVAAPLREQVLEVMRNAILDFRYKPGQRLIERELIEEIGVSRTTIREALRELDAEGLVTTVPQKGVIVVVPTPEDAAELYEVRAVLEALAARKFVERATDEEVADLKVAVERFADVVEADADIRDVLAAKDGIYDVLLEGARNKASRNILNGLQARVRMLRAASLSVPGRSADAVKEMRQLVEAIEARDAEEAARLCVGHLDQASKNGVQAISTFTAPTR